MTLFSWFHKKKSDEKINSVEEHELEEKKINEVGNTNTSKHIGNTDNKQVDTQSVSLDTKIQNKCTNKLQDDTVLDNKEISAVKDLGVSDKTVFVNESKQVDKNSKKINEEPVLHEVKLPEPQNKPSFLKRLMHGLKRTRENIGLGLVALLKGRKIDDSLFEDLETTLISADVGIETTEKLIAKLTKESTLHELKDGSSLVKNLENNLHDILAPVSKPLVIDEKKKPYVILMVGVNGVGKTTTIGKLANFYKKSGKSVMLAAGDTFRAAAVEQLQVWGQRCGVHVVAQSTGADSASVIFDALAAAKARGTDILIADTAGRLQNKANLMDELRKIVRVIKKQDPDAPHEILLTLDAGTGQNAISQVKLFNEVAPVTGLCLTKLDGTAKGGVIFSIADQFSIPIRFIGIGESIDELRSFDADDFIKALFAEDKE